MFAVLMPAHFARTLLTRWPFFALIFLAVAAPSFSQEPGPTEPSVLKVAISDFPPFVFRDEAGRPVGVSIDLWHELERESQIRGEFVWYPDVTSKLEAVERGEADVAMGGISITSDREVRLDFTQPSFHSGLGILARASTSPGLLATLFQFFTPRRAAILFGFLLLIVVAGHLMWLSERGGPSFDERYGAGVMEGMYWAVVTASTVGYGDKVPARRLGRFLAALVIFVSLPLFSLFTAELASSLTLHEIRSSIQGPEDLPRLRVGVMRGTTAAGYAERSGLRVQNFHALEDALVALREHGVDAVVHDAPRLQYFVQQEAEPWANLVGSRFEPQSYGLATASGSPLNEPLNISLLRLNEEGIVEQLQLKWLGR